MKIIVFGGTGRVGSSVIEQAIDAGHNVTAFVRDARRVKSRADRISLVIGNILDQSDVRSALASGFDAVFSCIGEAALRPSTVVTDGVRAIIAGMKDRGIHRFLGVSGTAEMPDKTFLGRVYSSF